MKAAALYTSIEFSALPCCFYKSETLLPLGIMWCVFVRMLLFVVCHDGNSAYQTSRKVWLLGCSKLQAAQHCMQPCDML